MAREKYARRSDAAETTRGERGTDAAGAARGVAGDKDPDSAASSLDEKDGQHGEQKVEVETYHGLQNMIWDG